METNIKSAATIHYARMFDDASGMPVTLSCYGYKFAFDFLGEEKCTLLSPIAGSMTFNDKALKVCRAAYTALRALNLTEEWYARNAAMYADSAR